MDFDWNECDPNTEQAIKHIETTTTTTTTPLMSIEAFDEITKFDFA